jgi:hypothetical protein
MAVGLISYSSSRAKDDGRFGVPADPAGEITELRRQAPDVESPIDTSTSWPQPPGLSI